MSTNNIMRALSSGGAPRVLTRNTLRRVIERVNPMDGRATNTIAESLVGVKALHKVADDVFLNYLVKPLPSPAEALRLVVPGAYLSLHMVLGQCGVLNNPSNLYTCVRPSTSSAPEGEILLVGRRFATNNPAPLFHVYALKPNIPNGDKLDDHIDGKFSYPRATPERAFCDWLYLAKNDVKALGAEPPLDCDMHQLDMDRLCRVASHLGVSDELECWLERHREYLLDVGNASNTSEALGF
ncbi:hypothetical protein [Rhizobium sp. MHM7A]|uniref:hypothetical protein n=1 Tax=Rhizobium sp. MHM7A TaxID=2583233 RepID=UPI0011062AC7|nr:hypothetical protein [Rhizobium sp. MHM7A]TLX16623.1 hypothetical protein FFR93_04585 [Rhizobium sp. MHM7A]